MWAYRHVGMIRKCVGGIKWQRIDNCQLLEHYVVYVLARRGEFIRLEFSSMVTECSYDYVFVYDGDTYDSPLLGAFSGATKPDVLIASSQYVSYFSDNIIVYFW